MKKEHMDKITEAVAVSAIENKKASTKGGKHLIGKKSGSALFKGTDPATAT